MDALRTAVLVALALFAAGYALWVARWFLRGQRTAGTKLSLIHISEPTRRS